MATRRSTRLRQSVSYVESPPNKKPRASMNSKLLEEVNEKRTPRTPRSTRKSVNLKPKSEEKYSPKKLRKNRTPSSKALESIVFESSPRTNQLIQESPDSREEKDDEQSIEVIQLDDTLDNDSFDKENIISNTPSAALFDEEEDVEGKRLYSFKTPKKGMMAQLANHTPKTPRHQNNEKSTPKTPKNLRLSELQKTPTSRPSAAKCTKTPRHMRDEIKKKLTKIKYHEESDFSPDESDYNPKESSSSSSSEAESGSESESEEEQKEIPKKTSTTIQKTPSMSTRKSTRNKSDYQYILQSDDFFSTQTTKTKTSDHTLERLKNSRLPHDQLIKLLSTMDINKNHQIAIKEINQDYKTYFHKWMTYFDENFTILLHGLGSKRNLLQAFHKDMLAKEHVIVVNGFFPSLTIRDILDPIANDLLELSAATSNPHETVNMIEETMKLFPEFHIYLIVHNIDGTMLRNDKAQSVLCRLAAIKNIRMIATIDHINAPLLWNNTKLSMFNFIWFDVTSYLPYSDETAYENSLLINNNGSMELSSLRSVFQSLTSNARGIYILIVKNQLNNGSNHNYQGISFKNLYSLCREAFLVSSDLALRAQMTEFLDHKLAKLKRSIDGAENITIPISNVLLQKFLNEES